ncbi:unnamed protein product [Oikopleura dioica]|uniref:Uncharacterized protein n=1 Tax=Oikopleura dioica TaxID=34765 RepID=E4XD56_OIKDI|nr:unnamed protein product [Oikopleura dioica]
MKFYTLFASSALAANTRAINGNAADLINDSLTTEVLHFKVRGSDIDAWNKLDDEIWTSYLAVQDGFVRKTTNVDRTCKFDNADCDVFNYVDWQTFAQWKAINAQELIAVDDEFLAACDKENIRQEMQEPVPLGTSGLAVLATTTSAATTLSGTIFALFSSLALFKL